GAPVARFAAEQRPRARLGRKPSVASDLLSIRDEPLGRGADFPATRGKQDARLALQMRAPECQPLRARTGRRPGALVRPERTPAIACQSERRWSVAFRAERHAAVS